MYLDGEDVYLNEDLWVSKIVENLDPVSIDLTFNFEFEAFMCVLDKEENYMYCDEEYDLLSCEGDPVCEAEMNLENLSCKEDADSDYDECVANLEE